MVSGSQFKSPTHSAGGEADLSLLVDELSASAEAGSLELVAFRKFDIFGTPFNNKSSFRFFSSAAFLFVAPLACRLCILKSN